MDKKTPDRQITAEVESLVKIIINEINEGKERSHFALELEKRDTYWKIGKHIKEHILQNSDRSDYGEYLFPKLALHLHISRTTLYQSVRFYEEYPEIVHTCVQLTWSHMRLLLTIADNKTREIYENKIISDF